jgi:hypothetical protein
MKRPKLVHFLAIFTDESINIKASITLEENKFARFHDLDIEVFTPKFPMQALRLLNAYQFTMKIVGLKKFIKNPLNLIRLGISILKFHSQKKEKKLPSFNFTK